MWGRLCIEYNMACRWCRKMSISILIMSTLFMVDAVSQKMTLNGSVANAELRFTMQSIFHWQRKMPMQKIHPDRLGKCGSIMEDVKKVITADGIGTAGWCIPNGGCQKLCLGIRNWPSCFSTPRPDRRGNQNRWRLRIRWIIKNKVVANGNYLICRFPFLCIQASAHQPDIHHCDNGGRQRPHW